MICTVPTKDDCQDLSHDFVELISRVLVEYVPVLVQYKSQISSHMEHEYSSEMSKRSEMVSMTYVYSIYIWVYILHVYMALHVYAYILTSTHDFDSCAYTCLTQVTLGVIMKNEQTEDMIEF